MIRVGDQAPDFEATTSTGRTLRLEDLRGKKNVVLFFFPKAFTPGCTAEVCTFRDAYDELVSADTEVVGVSTDDSGTQEKFAGAHRLPFPLIGDTDRRISNAYGMLGLFRSILGTVKRVTFVIDKRGVVRGVFHHELAIKRHLDDVREVLVGLRG